MSKKNDSPYMIFDIVMATIVMIALVALIWVSCDQKLDNLCWFYK